MNLVSYNIFNFFYFCSLQDFFTNEIWLTKNKCIVKSNLSMNFTYKFYRFTTIDVNIFRWQQCKDGAMVEAMTRWGQRWRRRKRRRKKEKESRRRQTRRWQRSSRGWEEEKENKNKKEEEEKNSIMTFINGQNPSITTNEYDQWICDHR